MIHDKIIVLTHNDMDAFGCLLCIKQKFKIDKSFFTNYYDINTVTDNIINYKKSSPSEILLITDINFSNNYEVLKKLCSCFKKVILIDHHLTDLVNYKDLHNLTFHYDPSICACKACYKLFNINNTDLKQFIDFINIYDLWIQSDPLFMTSLYFNEYLLYLRGYDFSVLDVISDKYINNLKLLLLQSKNFILDYKKKLVLKYKELEDKHLIYKSKNVTVVFTFDFFNSILIDEYSKGQKLVIGISNNVFKVRFNSESNISNESKLLFREKLMGVNNYGHLNAFTYKSSLPVKDELDRIFKLSHLLNL